MIHPRLALICYLVKIPNLRLNNFLWEKAIDYSLFLSVFIKISKFHFYHYLPRKRLFTCITSI